MQILIEIDAETLKRLEVVAPGRSRKRSAFVRAAIRKSLWEIEEAKTRRAYDREPDVAPPSFDPSVWESDAFGGFEPPAPASPAPARSPKGKRKRAADKSRIGAGRGRQ